MPDQMNRCKAKNKRAEPCGAAATETGYCHFHSKPDIAAELGRRGGRKNRHVMIGDLQLLPLLGGATGLRNALQQALADLYEGRLTPKTAAAFASLASALLRTFTPAEFEEQLKTLQKTISELQGAPQPERKDRADWNR